MGGKDFGGVEGAVERVGSEVVVVWEIASSGEVSKGETGDSGGTGQGSEDDFW